MLRLFSVYKRYPYKIPPRVKFFNVFRYFFTIPFLESLLLYQLGKGKTGWKRLIPPLYFYEHGTIREARRDGINFSLDISCLIDHSIFFHNLKEPTWDNLFKLVKQNFVILDVGANIGFLTLNLARACPEGFVFSFEPDSKTFNALKTNVGKNSFSNVSIHQLALGEQKEKKMLYRMYTNNPGANRMLPHAPDYYYEQESVAVSTCDRVIEELQIQHVDLLKIDVEGFELFVLKGAERTIKKFRPILFLELAEANLNQQGLTSKMLIEHIENLNYEVRDARTMEPVDKLKSDHHTDILCFSIFETIDPSIL